MPNKKLLRFKVRGFEFITPSKGLLQIEHLYHFIIISCSNSSEVEPNPEDRTSQRVVAEQQYGDARIDPSSLHPPPLAGLSKLCRAGVCSSLTLQLSSACRLAMNASGNSMTLSVRREHQKQQRLARTKEYQAVLDKNDWSKAELARQLGVSRAWVTTVLNDSVMI